MTNEKKNILQIIYSDIGKSGKVGARFTKVARRITEEGEYGLKIIARDNYDPKLDVDTPFYKALIAKAFRFFDIYITSPRTKIDQKIFDNFSLKRLSKDPRFFHLAHVDGTTVKTISKLKKQGSKVIFDVQMSPDPDMLHVVSDEFIEMLNISDRATVPSSFTKKVLKGCGVTTPMTVIPFGVDSKKFQPADGKKDSPIRFAFAGYISKRKGSDYLLEAWDELEIEDAELHLYGRIRKKLKKDLQEADSSSVKFHGFIDDLENKLPINHVFVFPSNQEGSAKAIYEAMACGLPVITTPNAGSVIRDGEEGFIIPPKDKEAIKEKIRYFYNNPEKIKEMGRKARKLAEEYTWERYAESVYEVYKQVLNESN